MWYSTACNLNLFIKKWGHRSRLQENDLFFFQLSFNENLTSCERARANHVSVESMRNAIEWNQLKVIPSKKKL